MGIIKKDKALLFRKKENFDAKQVDIHAVNDDTKEENDKKVKVLLKMSLVVVVFASFFISTSCVSDRSKSKLQDNKKPNIVIILIDTLRADHCSTYGYERETTPHMTRIAKDGLKLENYYVNSPWTKPSTASIITGLHPTAHGSRIGQFEELENKVSPVIEVLNPCVETMADILKENGYITYAFITNYHLTPKFGYAQGYSHYYFEPVGDNCPAVWKTDRELVDAGMQVLGNKKDKPVFIWCHLMSVHGYCFPREFNRFQPEHSSPIPIDAEQREVVKDYKYIEKAVANYDNSIWYTDRLVGDFFDFILKSAPNTIFIVTSDHGEEFYEHGGFEHARTLYNEILKVPCVIWGPGVPTGLFTGLSDSIDLLPTIIKNIGGHLNSNLMGQILFFQNKISSENIKKEIFAEQHHRGFHKRFAVIRRGEKMIINQHKQNGKRTFEFYSDGLSIEKNNVITRVDKKKIKKFMKRIKRYQYLTSRYFKQNLGQLKYRYLSPEDIKHLKSLGYIK
jgi:arylsulfatase A-like enzyme